MGNGSDVVTSDGTVSSPTRLLNTGGLWVFKQPDGGWRRLCCPEISGVPGRQIRKSLSGLAAMTDGGTSTSGTLKTS